MAFRASLAVAVCALAAPFAAHAASCEWAQRFATEMINLATQARASQNEIEARRLARDARPLAIDAAKEAKGCGCNDAIANFEDVARQASYAGTAANLTAIHGFAARIRTSSEKALDALRRCGS